MKMNSTKLLVALFISSVFTLKAQQNQAHAGHTHEHIDAFYLPLDFDKDSLQGFNEVEAWKQAQSSTENETLQKRVLAVLRRNYIDFKYGFSKPAPLPVVQGPCSNPGFETGTTAGWTTSESPNNDSQTMLPWSNLANTQANVVGTGFDPNVPTLPTVPAGGGNFALRLGPTGFTTGGNSYRASQTFTVTAANSVFIYRYAVVLNNTSPHSCSEQPFFNTRFEDCNNNNITCGSYNVSANGTGCSSGDPNFVAVTNTSGNSWSYLTWQTRAFDLTSYIGQCVNVEFTVGGCITGQAGHGGYAYIDANCSPMTLNLNGTDIPVGQTNNSFCGASTSNTLCAPPGFTYSWTGPGITGQTGQCVNTNSNGTFSVTLGIAGSTCAFNPVLYSTFNSAPNPTVTPSITQPICALPAGTASITVNGGTAPYTFSWTPAAPSSSVNSNLPPNTSYTVTAEDDNGCIGTTTFSINSFAGSPSYTLSNTGLVLSCTTPSTTLTFAQTNTNTSVSWGGPSGTITGTNVVVTSPGVYTYTAINTVSTCSVTGTVSVTGSSNIPVLTSTLTQPSCSSPIGSSSVSVSNGTAPYTYSWSPTVAAPSGTVNSNLPPGTNYTVSVTDALGCSGLTTFSINAFAGPPLYSLSNNPSLLVSCISPSTTLTFAPTNTNTSTSWTGPAGIISGTTTVVTATAAGTYSYVALNTVSTCSVLGTVVVTTDTVKPSATSIISCNINTFSLSASSTPSINLGWIAPGTPTASIGNPATSTAIGVYTLVAVNPNNGCVQTYTSATSVPQISVVSSPTTGLLTCLTTTINATASSTPSAAITWNNGTSTVTANQLPITASGSYTAIATNSLGCTSQSVITVSTNTFANVSAISSGIIPCNTGSVNIIASSTGIGSYSYSWQPSSPSYTGTVFTGTTAGTYTVIATNAVNGCTTSATSTLIFDNINASFDASVYSGLMPLPVTFTNTSFPNPVGTTYTWSFGDGNSVNSNDTIVNHLYNTSGNFPVILTATNGFCRDTAMRYIKVDLISLFEVPNVFTPNGDGKNDAFTFNAINMGEITITIFDRWGLKMFEATDIGNIRWDGKNKSGKTVTDGTYFYILTATGLDGVKYDKQGTISVFQ
jgi:gliding motility-associated-like protein